MQLSKYEQQEFQKIRQWKNPSKTWFDEVSEMVGTPFEKIGNYVLDIEIVEWVIEKAIGGTISTLNDFSQWTVRPNAVYEEYQKNKFHVTSRQEIYHLDLQDVDTTIGYLGAKYKGLAFTEGGVAGATAIYGIVPDILALIVLNQRAIGEYATYCGFDVSNQQERLFALHVLSYSSSPNDLAKELAMSQLIKIAKQVAQKKTWKQLEEYAFVNIVKIIAKALAIRLTKAKLAQVVPVAGALVGGGFNAYYTNKVCETAFNLYRERFLAEKYGEDMVKELVKPVDSYNPNYDDKI